MSLYMLLICLGCAWGLQTNVLVYQPQWLVYVPFIPAIQIVLSETFIILSCLIINILIVDITNDIQYIHSKRSIKRFKVNDLLLET